MAHCPSPRRPLSKQGTWRTYTTTDGLAALQVEHIVEDQEGYPSSVLDIGRRGDPATASCSQGP